MLDSLLHGQDGLARGRCAERGVEVIARRRPRRRRARATRSTAPTPSSTWRRSSATRPARATRELAHEVNVEATAALVADAAEAGVERLVFASTCSNYGRMADPTVPIDEDGELAPGVALRRAEGRRSRQRCSALDPAPFAVTCLRFATVYGVGAADALRPDRQRVHARPVGRPRARGLRRAVLAPLRPRPRRGARPSRTVLEAPRREGRRRGLQRRRLAARTTASSTSSR